jgi:hypothetical protein
METDPICVQFINKIGTATAKKAQKEKEEKEFSPENFIRPGG